MSQWIEQAGSDKKHNYWYIESSGEIVITEKRSHPNIYNIHTDLSEPAISGPFPTLNAAKAAYLILMAAQ